MIEQLPAGPDGRALVHAETRAEWRDWLARNHAESAGVWLVSWKRTTGRPAMPYEELVEELLGFGWIDSKAGTLDEERTMLLVTPRKKGSGWSRPNKERVARLEAAGLMAPAGQRVVDAARADGSWSKLDAVEALEVPDDLAAAFDAHPGAREKWDAFPPSARKAILGWIVQAKRADTRTRRVTETAECAARGERANERPER